MHQNAAPGIHARAVPELSPACVCVRVCARACVCARMYIRVYVCMYGMNVCMCVYVCIYVWMDGRMEGRMHASMRMKECIMPVGADTVRECKRRQSLALERAKSAKPAAIHIRYVCMCVCMCIIPNGASRAHESSRDSPCYCHPLPHGCHSYPLPHHCHCHPSRSLLPCQRRTGRTRQMAWGRVLENLATPSAQWARACLWCCHVGGGMVWCRV